MLPQTGAGGEGLGSSPLPPCHGIDLTRKRNRSPHIFRKITMVFFNQKVSLVIPVVHVGPTSLQACNPRASCNACSQMYICREALCKYCASMTKEKRCFY